MVAGLTGKVPQVHRAVVVSAVVDVPHAYCTTHSTPKAERKACHKVNNQQAEEGCEEEEAADTFSSDDFRQIKLYTLINYFHINDAIMTLYVAYIIAIVITNDHRIKQLNSIGELVQQHQ